LQIVALGTDVQDHRLARPLGQWTVVLDQIIDQGWRVLWLERRAFTDFRLDRFRPAVSVQGLHLDRPEIVTTRAAGVQDLLAWFRLRVLPRRHGERHDEGQRLR
jgi:hypothetical protein